MPKLNKIFEPPPCIISTTTLQQKEGHSDLMKRERLKALKTNTKL